MNGIMGLPGFFDGSATSSAGLRYNPFKGILAVTKGETGSSAQEEGP